MSVEIQEPNDLPPNSITDENAYQFEVLVYQQSQDVAGIKRLAIADWKSYLGFNTHKVNNVASYLGIPDEFDWEANEDKTWEDPDQNHYTLSHQVENLATKVGVNTNPQSGFQPILPRVETLESQVQTPDTGLLDRMHEAEQNITSLAEEIGPGTGGGALTTRVNALENKVGNARNVENPPTGLMLVQEEVEGVNGNPGLMQKMDAAENNIDALDKELNGDTSAGTAGLKSDFDDLNEQINDPTDGLAKQVEDLKNKVYNFRGSIKSVNDGTVTTKITLQNDEELNVPDDLHNGDIFDINPPQGTESIEINGKKYGRGNNIGWVVPDPSVPGSGYFDELGMSIDIEQIEEIQEKVDAMSMVVTVDSSWTSANISAGIYQCSSICTASSIPMLSIFIISFGNNGSVNTHNQKIDISNNFDTYWEIDLDLLKPKLLSGTGTRKLSIHKIGEV